jgi:hypothetical protein
MLFRNDSGSWTVSVLMIEFPELNQDFRSLQIGGSVATVYPLL